MNIVIPMAGAGSRFKNAGYSLPKPLIPVMDHKPMVQLAIESIPNRDKHQFIFIVQAEHISKYHIDEMLRALIPNCVIVPIDGLSEGAACTVLMATRYIDCCQPLLIINSDLFIPNFKLKKKGNVIYTTKSVLPNYSFVKTVEFPNKFFGYTDMVVDVSEKHPISDKATIGAYQWNKGSDFVTYAIRMIKNNVRYNNEFYVAPVYNQALDSGLFITAQSVKEFWSLGTPEEITYFWLNYGKR